VPPHEPTAPPAPAPTQVTRAASDATPEVGAAPLLDFRRTARRLATALTIIAGLVLAGWGVLAVTAGAPVRLLAELAGFGVLAAVAVEVVVVGGSAVRGMFTAGERGERLASADVSMIPPQLSRHRRR
jgi:hypothetical protein